MWLPQEVIRKKRDNIPLSADDIQAFVTGVTNNTVSEGQVAAFAMATLLNGMNLSERTILTEAVRDSGEVMSWEVGGPIVDKHSSGGVGDLVSLVLGPILAACGCYVPMISGRGLGHTGGTLDKLDAIKGYSTVPDLATFRRVVSDCGVAIVGQTAELAPADGIMYGIRDVTATVESIDLITASILSKKLAEGLDVLVMDVKVGNGAFMASKEQALGLAQSIVEVANNAGTQTSALITDMNQPLARSAGNALEILETVRLLKGDIDSAPLWGVIRSIAVQALVMAGIASSSADAEQRIDNVWRSGKAAERFERMVCLLGGPKDIITNCESYVDQAPVIRDIPALESGVISAIQTRDVGVELITLGGARTIPNAPIDYSVGFAGLKHIGEYVDKGEPLGQVHAKDNEIADIVISRVQSAYQIGGEIADHPLIHQIVTR